MSSSNKLWAVVKKLKVDGEEGEYDAVPVSWIQQPGVLRYPLQRKGTIIRMATNGDRIDSDDEFEVLDIEMCKATYENFDDAYEACIRKAHGRRSKSSSENEEKGRGKRKRILKKFSDDDDDDASAGDEFSADESLPTKAEAKAMAAKAFVQTVMEKTRNLPPPKPPALGLNSSQGERAKNMGGLVPSKPKCTQHKNVPKTGQSKPLLPNKCSVLDEIQRAALIKHPVQPLRDDRDESPHFDSSFMAFNADGPSDLSTPRNKDHHEESTAPDLGPVSQNIVPSSSKNSSKKSKPSTVVDIRCKTGKKIKHFCPLRLKCSEREAVFHALCSISGDLNYLVQEMKRGKKGSEQSPFEPVPAEWGDLDFPDGFLDNLPFQSLEAFLEFDAKLKDTEYFLLLKKTFAWQFRHDAYVTKTARNLVKELIGKDAIPAQFSLKGGHGNKKNAPTKLNFETLATYKLVLSVVRTVWRSRCADFEEQVEKTLKQFLVDCNPIPAKKN